MAQQEQTIAAVARRLLGTEPVARQALEELVARVGPKLQQHLTQKLDRWSRFVDDALQATWLTVWEKRKKIDRERSVTGWIYRIARNKVIDELRRKELTSYDLEQILAPPRPSDNDLRASGRTALEEILRMLRDLSESDRRILRQYANAPGDQWITPEFEREMGMCPGALRTRLSRLKERLRQGNVQTGPAE